MFTSSVMSTSNFLQRKCILSTLLLAIRLFGSLVFVVMVDMRVHDYYCTVLFLGIIKVQV